MNLGHRMWEDIINVLSLWTTDERNMNKYFLDLGDWFGKDINKEITIYPWCLFRILHWYWNLKTKHSYILCIVYTQFCSDIDISVWDTARTVWVWPESQYSHTTRLAMMMKIEIIHFLCLCLCFIYVFNHLFWTTT